MLHKINTLAIVAGFLFALASMSIDSFGQNAIVEIKDLVQEAHEAVWTDGNENSIDFGQTAGFYGAVLRGNKLGGPNGSFYSRSGELLVDETISSDTIDIGFAPTLGRNASVVRGVYTIQLPVKKRIQLEMIYDLFLDTEGMRNPGELYVEVYERNALNPNQWLKTGELHQKESMKVPLGLERVNQIRESRFVTHHFVANLSYWAGREVQVALVAAIPAHAVSKQRARWCSARLVGASFNFMVDKPIVKSKTRSPNQKISKLGKSPEKVIFVTYAKEIVDITDVTNPEASISTVHIGGRWLAYCHALLDPVTSPLLTTVKKRGTIAFDLQNEDNMYYIDMDTLGKCVLRGIQAESAAKTESGTPFFVIKPVNPIEGGDNSDWRIGYTGITSAVTAENRVHAFIHTEDWYQDGVNQNISNGTQYWYVRIGYARSEIGNGTDFTWMYDSSVGSPTPVIECFQPEWAYTPHRQSFGAAMPAVIKNSTGDFYYIFYTRFLDGSPKDIYAQEMGYDDWSDYNVQIRDLIGGFVDQICIARATTSEVVASDYASEPNPWTKGFYNQTTEKWEWKPARVPDGATESASYSYPVIHETPSSSYRSSPKIHYAAELSEYMIICKGAEGFYIYVTNNQNLLDWGDEILLLEEGEDELIHDPSLVSYLGDDKYGVSYYKLYYSWDPNTTKGGHYLTRRGVWFIDYD